MKPAIHIMWFRRDLRLRDNAALYHALRGDAPVLPLFIFDRVILDALEDPADRRVEFIHAALEQMQTELKKLKSNLEVHYGFPKDIFRQLLERYQVQTVFTNHDYEPYATERDAEIQKVLEGAGARFQTYKDQVVFEKSEVVKGDGSPYTVFTPYSRQWKSKLTPFYLKAYPTERYFKNFFKAPYKPVCSLESIGFQASGYAYPPQQLSQDIIAKYNTTRDFPGIEQGTSRIGIHLRFGTVSIRELATIAQSLNETYLNELIWREFYQAILWHFPHVGKGRSFKVQYENIPWRNNEAEFKQWTLGATGYPIVDAGIRELNATGFMHNRVRMVVASFLTKHLLIDYRWGEAYFAGKLLDFELASNNGGWQWAAGSGCDAAPYFRVFNPTLQALKFDKGLAYIRKWIPELDTLDYPRPIVDHEFARKRAIETYSKALRER